MPILLGTEIVHCCGTFGPPSSLEGGTEHQIKFNKGSQCVDKLHMSQLDVVAKVMINKSIRIKFKQISSA